jgi:hypothetical protein
MQHFNPVPGEVVGIERQYPADAVDVHRGNQPRVVHFGALNLVLHHQALPFAVNRRRVRQEAQDPLDLLDLAQRQRGGETQAVIGDGTGYDVPELEIFCSVKYTGSPPASSRATLSTASE